MVTDAALQDDILAVTSHIDNAFLLHFLKLNATGYQAEYMYAETISQGEVTALSLYKTAGRMHAIACLNLGDTVVIERYCVTDQIHEETILLSDGMFRTYFWGEGGK